MAGRGKLIVMAMTATMVIGTASMSSAANPQLKSASGSVNSSGQLIITFRATGLGSTTQVTVGATGTASATYGCVNGSGKVPNAANKRDTGSGFNVGELFTSDSNGSARGTLTVSPASAPNDFSCPGGQTMRLLSVSYSGVVVNLDTDNSAPFEDTQSIGPFSKTVYP